MTNPLGERLLRLEELDTRRIAGDPTPVKARAASARAMPEAMEILRAQSSLLKQAYEIIANGNAAYKHNRDKWLAAYHQATGEAHD